MQSRLMHRLVLIAGEVTFKGDALQIEPLGELRVPRALTASLHEEEIEDELPGLEQEREAEWYASTKHFRGFTTTLPDSLAVCMGPFRISEKLLSQYISRHAPVVQLLDAVQLRNASAAMKRCYC